MPGGYSGLWRLGGWPGNASKCPMEKYGEDTSRPPYGGGSGVCVYFWFLYIVLRFSPRALLREAPPHPGPPLQAAPPPRRASLWAAPTPPGPPSGDPTLPWDPTMGCPTPPARASLWAAPLSLHWGGLGEKKCFGVGLGVEAAARCAASKDAGQPPVLSSHSNGGFLGSALRERVQWGCGRRGMRGGVRKSVLGLG